MNIPTSCACGSFSRQSFLKKATVISAIAATAPLSMPNNAEASPSEDGSQAPGFYRMMLGEFELTALNDGTIDFPMDTILTNAKPGEVDALFHAEYLKPPIRTSINQFLVNTGSKLVLVDTGAGSFLGPTLGRLPANMKAAGYDPAQIDEVLITHMHVDHVGGLIHDGKASFPNATIHVTCSRGAIRRSLRDRYMGFKSSRGGGSARKRSCRRRTISHLGRRRAHCVSRHRSYTHARRSLRVGPIELQRVGLTSTLPLLTRMTY